MSERQLGKITAVLADLGLEVTYAYDDLVFVQHSAFLLQFRDDPSRLKLFVHTECDPKETDRVAGLVIEGLNGSGFEVVSAGRYFLTPNEDETLNVEFEKQPA
jgi:hypothetical protein